jgi:hypothetical protein
MDWSLDESWHHPHLTLCWKTWEIYQTLDLLKLHHSQPPFAVVVLSFHNKKNSALRSL